LLQIKIFDKLYTFFKKNRLLAKVQIVSLFEQTGHKNKKTDRNNA